MSVRFPYDREKAENAVLWLLQKHGGAIQILKLIKLIFFADRLHLARYGRPLTGGRYVAMPHGPVPSNLYEDICSGQLQSLAREEGGNKIVARSRVNEDVLSESDLEVLEEINSTLGRMDGFTLRDKTHNLIAYKKNWVEDGAVKSYNLPYEDFFEDLSSEEKEMLQIINDNASARTALE